MLRKIANSFTILGLLVSFQSLAGEFKVVPLHDGAENMSIISAIESVGVESNTSTSLSLGIINSDNFSQDSFSTENTSHVDAILVSGIDAKQTSNVVKNLIGATSGGEYIAFFKEGSSTKILSFGNNSMDVALSEQEKAKIILEQLEKVLNKQQDITK